MVLAGSLPVRGLAPVLSRSSARRIPFGGQGGRRGVHTRARGGQAMLETVLAVLFITLMFLCVFQVAHMVTTKILLDHAAARAARARAVGFNDWMCLKSARVAMIPVAGPRTWPAAEDGDRLESALVPIYMETDNEGMANGILEYERWRAMDFGIRSGLGNEVESHLVLDIPRFYSRGDEDSDTIEIEGEARVESHFPLYMNDQGL